MCQQIWRTVYPECVPWCRSRLESDRPCQQGLNGATLRVPGVSRPCALAMAPWHGRVVDVRCMRGYCPLHRRFARPRRLGRWGPPRPRGPPVCIFLVQSPSSPDLDVSVSTASTKVQQLLISTCPHSKQAWAPTIGPGQRRTTMFLRIKETTKTTLLDVSGVSGHCSGRV